MNNGIFKGKRAFAAIIGSGVIICGLLLAAGYGEYRKRQKTEDLTDASDLAGLQEILAAAPTEERAKEAYEGFGGIREAESPPAPETANYESAAFIAGTYCVVGVQDGYIAVFYQNQAHGGNEREITSTPVAILSAEEQERLRAGIYVQSELELLKILEDYGS